MKTSMARLLQKAGTTDSKPVDVEWKSTNERLDAFFKKRKMKTLKFNGRGER